MSRSRTINQLQSSFNKRPSYKFPKIKTNKNTSAVPLTLYEDADIADIDIEQRLAYLEDQRFLSDVLQIPNETRHFFDQ